jgi:integrase
MSPKPRNAENRPLPKRWRYKHGAYYYRVPPGMEDNWDGKKEFLLGKSLPDAYRAWSERLNSEGSNARTMAQLMDRYLLEVVPTKAHKSQESNRISLTKLRPVFAHMRITSVKPKHAYQYKDAATRKHGATSTNRDLEVLSHLLSMAVEWGLIDRNELKGQVKKNSTPPRDRLVEDWEIAAALKVAPPIIDFYIRLKLMTGLRRGDILRLRLPDIHDDGIHVQPHKTAKTTGKRLIIEWDDGGELQAVISGIQRLPPRRIGDAPLFVTRQGKPYIKKDGSANAFDSLWQRFMRKALDQTDLTERFQERDLRAKVASESDSLEEASERLAHAFTATTKRIYRRKPTRVKPLILGVTKSNK